MDSKGSKAPSGDFYRLLCLSVVGPPVRHLKQRLFDGHILEHLLEVNLPYDSVCPSVRRSVAWLVVTNF